MWCMAHANTILEPAIGIRGEHRGTRVAHLAEAVLSSPLLSSSASQASVGYSTVYENSFSGFQIEEIEDKQPSS